MVAFELKSGRSTMIFGKRNVAGSFRTKLTFIRLEKHWREELKTTAGGRSPPRLGHFCMWIHSPLSVTHHIITPNSPRRYREYRRMRR